MDGYRIRLAEDSRRDGQGDDGRSRRVRRRGCCKAHGIKACWFIQLGYPSETWDDLLATRDLIRDERPDEIGVSVAYPLPGTVFYERVRAQLGRQRNWKDTGDLAMLFQGTFNSEFYRRVRDILHEEVESGLTEREAWDDLENRVDLHRSPSPISLAVGT